MVPTVLFSTAVNLPVESCTVLYCTVLYCTVLYCTVLYCTVPVENCTPLGRIYKLLTYHSLLFQSECVQP